MIYRVFNNHTDATETVLLLIKWLVFSILKNGIDQIPGDIKEEFKRAEFCSKWMINITTPWSRSAEHRNDVVAEKAVTRNCRSFRGRWQVQATLYPSSFTPVAPLGGPRAKTTPVCTRSAGCTWKSSMEVLACGYKNWVGNRVDPRGPEPTSK